jgi:hypothetical protein
MRIGLGKNSSFIKYTVPYFDFSASENVEKILVAMLFDGSYFLKAGFRACVFPTRL